MLLNVLCVASCDQKSVDSNLLDLIRISALKSKRKTTLMQSLQKLDCMRYEWCDGTGRRKSRNGRGHFTFFWKVVTGFGFFLGGGSGKGKHRDIGSGGHANAASGQVTLDT
jgi:hypothetical protein